VILESRYKTDDHLRGSRGDGGDVGVAGGGVVGLHVDAARPANHLAAINSTLEGDAGNADRFEIPWPHDPISLHVPQKSVDVGGGGHLDG
jgi:hypothetical protein